MALLLAVDSASLRHLQPDGYYTAPCEKCSVGSHRAGCGGRNPGTCVTNQCNCPNGVGARGQDCPRHDAVECVSCSDGYFLQDSTSTCVLKQCACTNGVGARSTACPEHNADKCASCSGGYYLKDFSCAVNQCACANGVGTSGTACSSNGAPDCASCNVGFRQVGNACESNMCTCANGVGTTGESCSSHGATSCASCNTGYYLSNSTCVASFFEAGTFSMTGVAWKSVSFTTQFAAAPIVIPMMPTKGGHECALRIKSVTASGFMVATAEPSPRDGEHPAFGDGWPINYVAVLPGDHTLPDGTKVKAGSVSTTNEVYHSRGSSQGSSNEWDTVTFGSGYFTSTPAVLTQIQTLNNEQANLPNDPSKPFLTVVTKSATSTSVQVSLERAEVASYGSVSSAESIGWVAIQPAVSSFTAVGGVAVKFEAGVSADKFKGWSNTAQSLTFQQSFSSAPIVVANQMTRDGGDGGWLRLKSTSATEAKLVVDEDRKYDGERSHTTEKIGYFVASVSFSQ